MAFPKVNAYSSRAAENWYLYTKGGTYSLDGIEYKGEYHLNNGIAYTGPIPSDNAKLLRRLYNNPDHYRYEQLFDFDVKPIQFRDPTPYVFTPSEQAYANGFDFRFFVEKINDDSTFAIEIDARQYRLYGKPLGIDNGLYTLAEVEWKLTGTPEAIEEHNRYQLLLASFKVPSVVYAVKNFKELARYTQVSTDLDQDGSIPIQVKFPRKREIEQGIQRYYINLSQSFEQT